MGELLKEILENLAIEALEEYLGLSFQISLLLGIGVPATKFALGRMSYLRPDNTDKVN